MNVRELLAFISMPGGGEWMIIFVVMLLLFGAKKLPELARGLGKAMGEFKTARREFEDEIRRAELEIKEEPKKIPQQRVAETPAPRSDPAKEGAPGGSSPDDPTVC